MKKPLIILSFFLLFFQLTANEKIQGDWEIRMKRGGIRLEMKI